MKKARTVLNSQDITIIISKVYSLDYIDDLSTYAPILHVVETDVTGDIVYLVFKVVDVKCTYPITRSNNGTLYPYKVSQTVFNKVYNDIVKILVSLNLDIALADVKITDEDNTIVIWAKKYRKKTYGLKVIGLK